MDKKLKQAIDDLEDALVQGRELIFYIVFEYADEMEVNFSVAEPGIPEQEIFADTGYETFEDALIAIAEHL